MYKVTPVAEAVKVEVLALPLAIVTVTSGRSQEVELGERSLVEGAAVDVIAEEVEEMGCK